MEPSVQIPLTPELTAAVHAGGGFAQVEDPNTHRVYYLIEQAAPPTIADDYVRAKIDEAYAEGAFEPLDMAAIKAEFQRRQSLKNLARE
ncbi:MAG: hypothetical protein AB7G28_05255 [Pirellulales bacterium]